MKNKHTPGPWSAEETEIGFDIWASAVRPGKERKLLAQVNEEDDPSFLVGEQAANAELSAAAPDHAALLALLASGHVRWHPFAASTGGELAFDGLRYSTRLDDFGCPMMPDHLRSTLRRAGFLR